MIVNERQTEEGLFVSVCDPDVMGETFEEGPVSLTVSEEFYGGEHREEDEVLDSLRRATVANIVGKRSVDVAVEAGFIDEDAVLDIEGTLHAQLLRLG
ncbi:DUF424 domain-containing protein [Haloarchaeobius sp. HME9146]|uniref:DUF424 domain-containing protein n=1 Tax=Haloarchaeobius sp. HME9146 TaxID=2978732 RepID=UPI0021C10A0C|nr:DUF424 domain-containing protein [Haloarchaeobius sp. HME9146]MCT9094979.1 DUF424 domain-containing protein [Haloarchaeobius sp. HME9146]